ncbi:MAG: thioredoxin domain-containing protein, partial [Magnetococcales bacterium]|nr:thioredoxin domain-containing protein [Magnetococcales bacterium]
IHGGTYDPPKPGWGRPSFKQLLSSIAKKKKKNRSGLLKDIDTMQAWLLDHAQAMPPVLDQPVQNDPAQTALEFWLQRCDPENGGFGDQPKFPQPTILSHILRQAAKRKNIELAQPILFNLDRMAVGGIRDQLGGAFHRYSTDRAWQVPHFEIMLHDNALLARVYLEAWQLTGLERYAWVVRGILDDLLERFCLPDGAFMSSLDADSEGEEGRYYTWTRAEVMAVLGQKQGEAFATEFVDDIEAVVDGRGVVRFLGKPEDLVARCQAFSVEMAQLVQARTRRLAPAKDDKILVSWNALMLSALAKAGAALQVPGYLQAAQVALKAIDRGEMYHSRRGEQIGEGVFLDDYAFLIQALLDCYEAWFDSGLLQRAEQLAKEMMQRFRSANQPLQLTPLDRQAEIPARIEWNDGVIPSGNSVAWIVLNRLAVMLRSDFWEQEALNLRFALEGCLQQAAPMVTELLWGLEFLPDSACHITGSGSKMPEMLQAIRSRLIPGLVLSHKEGEATSVQVCKKQFCHPPATTAEILLAQIDS